MFHTHPWLVGLFCTCCILPLIENRNQLGFAVMQVKCYAIVMLRSCIGR